MKKIIASILALALFMTMCGGFTAFADDSQVPILWYGDYSDTDNIKLIITFDSPIVYNHRVTASMYRADVTPAAVTYYDRIKEMPVPGEGKALVEIKVGSDLDYQNMRSDEYKVVLRGSGNGGDALSQTETVYILTKDEINANLADLNRAVDAAAVRTSMLNVNDALKIESTDITDNRIGYFIKIKSEDFANNMRSILNLLDSWQIAGVIEHLHTVGASGLKAKVESADFLGVDFTNSDYTENSTAVYNDLYRVRTTYEYGSYSRGINSASTLAQALKQYIALETIDNLGVEDDVEGKIKEYYGVLGISEDYQAKYEDLSANDKGKVIRNIVAADFVDPKDIIEMFEDAVDFHTSDNTSNSNRKPSSGGGGGGSSYSLPGGVETHVIATPQQAQFADCSDHWASSYISSLAKKNVISGYSDGNFYPERKVAREEFIKMIISATGLYKSTAECEFKDVGQTDWYYRFVASAVSEGIINGVDAENFGTGKSISRQDMAVITTRILNRFGIDIKTSSVAFTDSNAISEYAKDAVAILCGSGVLSGFEDGSFRPDAALTRAEAAKIICLIVEKVSQQ